MPKSQVESTVGFEAKDDGIEVTLTMPLAHAKALQRIVDHVTLQDCPEPSNDDHEMGIEVSSLLGAGLEMDLPAVAEEQKQAILS
jgi:hypothetical protein